MKSFKEYSNILETEISLGQTGPESRTDDEKYQYIVEALGGEENYKNSGYEYLPLYESKIIQYIEKKANDDEFKDVFGGQISKTAISFIVGKIIEPYVEGTIAQKYTLIWYILSYGLVESMFKLIKQTMDEEKEVDLCVILASGVVEGFQAWATLKVLKQLLSIIGFKTDMKGFGGMSLDALTQNVRASLFNQVNDDFVEEVLCEWSDGTPVGDYIEEMGDRLNDLKEYVVELFS